MFNFIRNLIKKLLSEKDNWKDGLIESPTDFRDIPLRAVKKEFFPLPKSYRIPYFLEIKNQGNEPICVGASTATLKEEKERREQNFINFDMRWIYKECKKIDGLPNMRGTYFRSGLKVLQKTGAKPLNEGDYEPYRIGGYIKVEANAQSIKQAIYEYGVVLAGFRGSNQGWKDEFIRPPKVGEQMWGHATALIGWNEQYIIGQNSWGENRPGKGYFYFDENYLPFECWAVLTDLPNNWKELIGNKEKPKYHFDNNLYLGLRNDEVKILQDCLKYDGCFPQDVDSTGYFGRITLNAVINFQKRYSINPAVGFVGTITRRKLNEIFS